MDQLDKVVLFQISKMLDFNSLISLCLTNTRFNTLICQQDAIWNYKLNREFPDWKKNFVGKPVRKVYSLLISLTKLKISLYYGDDVYWLFKMEAFLYSTYKQINTLPPEIGLLTNLKHLYLNNNMITTLPSEIGLLTNLSSLALDHNQITKLPSEIGLLTDLTVLFLENNLITTLPPEMCSLNRLQTLYLDEKVTNVPSNLKEILTIFKY